MIWFRARFRLFAGLASLIALRTVELPAPISTDIVDRNREAFHRQATDPDITSFPAHEEDPEVASSLSSGL